MSITGIDGALAGMQPVRFFYKAATPALIVGKPQSTWALAGIPGPGSFSASLAGVALVAPQNGQLPHVDPGSGNSYLSRFEGSANAGGTLLLCDRLWHNGGFTAVTTAQTITSAAFPARDNAGAVSGAGVLVGLEYNVTGAANTPAVTMSYTNSGGTSGRTASNAFAIATPAAGSFIPFGLQAGDLGVQSIQTVTFNAAPTAGSCNLVAYRVLAALDLPTINSGNSVDLLTGGMPQIFNGSVPFVVLVPAAVTASAMTGSYQETQG